MNLIDIVPNMSRVSSSKGGEYHGPCPSCGGRDRFHVWPGQKDHGTWWCRGCERGGDAIAYFREVEGMSYRDACGRLGIDPGTAPAINASPKKQAARSRFTPTVDKAPSELWRNKALAMVMWCHDRLLHDHDRLAWLVDRGISYDLVQRYMLGANPADLFRERASWGLPAELKDNGAEKKLWIPAGLVIPVMDQESGDIVQIRVRRDGADAVPRYYVVPGSSRRPLVSRMDAGCYVVVESGLDAILLDGVAGDLAGMVALGNDSAKPPADLFNALERSAHIAVALDSDEPRKNKKTGEMMAGAGVKASRWWLDMFRQAERLPVIGGKDPGDAYRAGVDLRAWVLASLPPRFHLAREEERGLQAVEMAAADDCREVELTDGRIIYVTGDRSIWDRLVADGKVVFSANELERLRSAVNYAGDSGQTIVDAAIMAKEVFAGAYVRRGGAARHGR